MIFDFFVPMNNHNTRARSSWWGAIATRAAKTITEADARMIVATNPVKVTAKFILPCPISKRNEAPHVSGPSALSLGLALNGLEKIMIAREEQITELKISKEYGTGYSVGANLEVETL